MTEASFFAREIGDVVLNPHRIVKYHQNLVDTRPELWASSGVKKVLSGFVVISSLK